MTIFAPRFWARVLRLLILICSLIFLAGFLFTSISRISFPFELEWLEGGIWQGVQRLAHGQALYQEPSPDYVPFIYPPVYFVAGRWAASLFGDGFFPLRLISLLATAGIFAQLFYLAFRATGKMAGGFLAVGLFAGSFSITGFWLDLARVDSLGLFFCLLAFSSLLAFRTPSGAAISGLFIVLGTLTKQTFSIFIIPAAMLAGMRISGKATLILCLTAFLGILSTAGFLDRQSSGWFWEFFMTIPSKHAWGTESGISTLLTDSCFFFPLVGTTILLFAVKGLSRGYRAFVAVTLCISLFSSVSARLHAGGYVNVYLPLLVVLSLGTGISWNLLIESSSTKNRWPSLLTLAISPLILLQFFLMVYDPWQSIPGDENIQSGNDLIETIKSVPGKVLIPCHPYLAQMAGKEGSSHYMAEKDFLGVAGDQQISTFFHVLGSRLAKASYQMILLDDRWYVDLVNPHYRSIGRLFSDPNALRPVTGLRIRPEWILVPRTISGK